MWKARGTPLQLSDQGHCQMGWYKRGGSQTQRGTNPTNKQETNLVSYMIDTDGV